MQTYKEYIKELHKTSRQQALNPVNLGILHTEHKLKTTEKLAIEMCDACLLIIKDQPTIRLINKTLKELKNE